jgi:hypothetical protein
MNVPLSSKETPILVYYLLVERIYFFYPFKGDALAKSEVLKILDEQGRCAISREIIMHFGKINL